MDIYLHKCELAADLERNNKFKSAIKAWNLALSYATKSKEINWCNARIEVCSNRAAGLWG